MNKTELVDCFVSDNAPSFIREIVSSNLILDTADPDWVLFIHFLASFNESRIAFIQGITVSFKILSILSIIVPFDVVYWSLATQSA